MEKLIAYCGIDCAECGAYLATKNNDQALREKTAAEWSKKFNFVCPPEMLNCTSCKSTGVRIVNCSQCEVRNCASGKGLENCGACKDFNTCETIKGFLEHTPSLRDNLVQK